MKKKHKILISGGGTGGHIYPALSIANELKAQYVDIDILFVGAKDKMEMQKVPAAGYPIKGLWISGIQRKLTLSNLAFPFKLISSLWKSLQIIRQFKPDIVIGTGGFASGAVLKVAQWKNIPTIIQEQNSYPGLTNKWLADKSKAICVAYDGLDRFFPKSKIKFTGNPVRQDLINVDMFTEEAKKYFKLDHLKKTVVVLGGSLGARRVNQLIESFLPLFKELNVNLIWQCGKGYYSKYKKYHSPSEGIQVLDFIEKMSYLYASSDVIVSRAGASSVSELCLVGKPVIFIPSPNVAEDHQTKNAQNIVNEEAAVMIKEQDLESSFQLQIERLLRDEKYIKKLSKNITKLARPNATKQIVEEVKNYL